ncbi:tRNA preQ1(34) S-adenosylmethionine ribosyltransferase-isomerase QueA [Dethiosulfatarculus sandiegensis]|uniref:S-adenosylmethionine:tRNA ribosyltransferase-isomerase n=1 Tax=Dethiosulfatarculus sandiegensis TaxID=1429043 RepID=A0A0D2HKX7_9BACT|nr:tRNA preQ1(34) S-adenosylmethionine ribosyltransferase-isomerase QueA [Dethiosulfatarculus sandiegensis]KIX11303.1 S-adenosylmethionine tRNA ribosyltransferase [Dethiosulfatarculus sandiegensis]
MNPALLRSAEASSPLDAYDYQLPPELIAQHPAPRRVQARLMVLAEGQAAPVHKRAYNLLEWLRKDDLLVINNTSVVPARLRGRKPTGGKVEVFLLSPAHPLDVMDDGSEVHETLIKTHRRLAKGARINLDPEENLWAEVVEVSDRGKALVKFPGSALSLASDLGEVPLPPYIKRPDGPLAEDKQRYQTVYAHKQGAVAAPTAGLHLSKELMAALLKRGVRVAPVTLHVGYGTFAEPSAEDLASGKLHSEWVEISCETARAVEETRQKGGRVICVGTTSLRAVEWRGTEQGLVEPGAGWCDILIDESSAIKVADGILTNFHLPRTTLLMLVAAMAGRERILAAYAEAIRMKYRFYSFGDAMLII